MDDARLFVCARCRRQVLICSRCDRGQQYCARSCRALARRESLRAAAGTAMPSASGAIGAGAAKGPVKKM